MLFFFTAFATKNWHYKINYASFGDKIRTDMMHKMADYKERGIKEFAGFGVSMGSTYVISLIKHTLSIGCLVLITVYGSAAQEIWEYPLLKKMKKIYTDKGMTMQGLEDAYPYFENTQKLEGLKDTKILLYASRRDKTIRNENTQRLIDAAKAAKLDIETVIGDEPHVQFIIKNSPWPTLARIPRLKVGYVLFDLFAAIHYQPHD